jgi:hypothetical protein
MSYNNFKPIVWSNHIQTELEKASVMQEDCNTEFEGEAKHASRVKILGVSRPTIGTYDGTDIGEPEIVADTEQYLDIDQAKFFNFGVDDVDKAQSIEGLMPALMQESAAALAQERDRFIASKAVDAGKLSASTAVSDAASAKAAVDEGFVWLWGNDVKINDEVVITVTPWFYNLFKEALTDLYTDNVDLIKRGIVGMYNGAMVKISTNLHNDGTDDYHLTPFSIKNSIDWAEVVTTLREIGYQGLFNLELPGEAACQPPLYILKRKLLYIKDVIDYMLSDQFPEQ